MNPTLGCDLDDLRLDVKSAVRQAAYMRFTHVEVGAAAGEVSPERLSQSGRRHFVRFLDQQGLKLASLSADMPHLRFTDPAAVDRRVEHTRRILDMAREMGVTCVSASVGAWAHPESGEPSPVALEALSRIGDAADHFGICFALRPSYDTGDRLVTLLNRVNCPSMRVCLDPAAIVMTGGNPLAGVERWIEQLALVHARDATAGAIDRATGEGHAGRETRLGEGDVDFVGLLQALRDADYHEPLIVRRADARSPVEDIAHDRDVLTQWLARQRP